MAQIPSEEQLRQEIRAMLAINPQMMRCVTCRHYGKITSFCDKHRRTTFPNVPGCKSYESNEEMLVRQTVRELSEQARECEKIEFLLAMALTSANMTTLFIEDFERRVRGAYKREKAKAQARKEKAMLKKDLDLAEQMAAAFKGITQCLERMKDYYHQSIAAYLDKIDGDLGKVESLYRHYIQSHVDKIFKKKGGYNVEANDNFQSDAGEFATILLEFARIAHHNKENADKLYEMMESMQNNNSESLPITFCLDKKDIAHYRMKD